MNDENRTRVNTLPDLADSIFISYNYYKKDCLLTFKIESWSCILILISFKTIHFFVDYGGRDVRSLWKIEQIRDVKNQTVLKSRDSVVMSDVETLYQFNANSCEDGFDIEDCTYDIAAEEVFGQQYEVDCEPLRSRVRAQNSSIYEAEDQLTGLKLTGSELISYETQGDSLIIYFEDECLNTIREFTCHEAIFFADWGVQKIDTLSIGEVTDRVIIRAIDRFDTTPPDWRLFKHYRFTGEDGKVGLEVVAAGISSKFVNS